MANLGPQHINQSFGDLLQLPNGLTPAIQNVQDGSGNVTPLEISTTAVDLPIVGPDGSGMLSDLGGASGSNFIGFEQAGTGAVLRTSENKMRETVSVLDFGADPTGETDSTDNIQNALDFAASINGCTIVFPHGNYVCNGTLNLAGTPTGITLTGQGRDNTGLSSSKITYTGTASVFFNLPNLNTRFISIDNLEFSSTNVAFTGRLLRLNVFNLSISRCFFAAANDQAFALLDVSQSVGVQISTSYFRKGQYCIYGIGMTTVLFKECNIGTHGSYGAWLDGCQSVTFLSCALEQDQTDEQSNCIRAVNMNGLTVQGCWFGDVITTAGSPLSNQISFSGDGLNVTGNYLNGDGYNKQTSISILAASQGINVSANYMSNLSSCLNLGAGIAKHVTFTSNRVRQSNATVTGTVASGGNAILQNFSFGEAGSNLNITGSFLFDSGSGLQFGSGGLLNYYETGSFTPSDASGAGLVFSNQSGFYTRIGKLVICQVNFQYPVTADGSQARISLPFVAENNFNCGGGVFYVNTPGIAGAQPNVAGNQSYFLLSNVAGGTAYLNVNASGVYFRGTVIYRAF